MNSQIKDKLLKIYGTNKDLFKIFKKKISILTKYNRIKGINNWKNFSDKVGEKKVRNFLMLKIIMKP